MYQSININAFHAAFESSDTYKNNFSYEGRCALFEMLEELEAESGEPMQFDMIALCCYYSESTALEVFENYNNVVQEFLPEDWDTISEDEEREEELHLAVERMLNENSSFVIASNGNYIYQSW